MVFEDNSEGMRNSCSVLCSFSYASVVCVSVGSCISLCCDTLFFRFTLHSHKPTQQKSNSLKGPSNTRQRNIQLCLHEMNTRKSLVKGERFIRFVSVSATPPSPHSPHDFVHTPLFHYGFPLPPFPNYQQQYRVSQTHHELIPLEPSQKSRP